MTTNFTTEQNFSINGENFALVSHLDEYADSIESHEVHAFDACGNSYNISKIEIGENAYIGTHDFFGMTGHNSFFEPISDLNELAHLIAESHQQVLSKAKKSDKWPEIVAYVYETTGLTLEIVNPTKWDLMESEARRQFGNGAVILTSNDNYALIKFNKGDGVQYASIAHDYNSFFWGHYYYADDNGYQQALADFNERAGL